MTMIKLSKKIFPIYEIVDAFYDLYGDEPETTDGWQPLTASQLWESLPSEAQAEITEYLA